MIYPCLVLEFTVTFVYWAFDPFFALGVWSRCLRTHSYAIYRFVFSRSAELNGPLHFWHLGL